MNRNYKRDGWLTSNNRGPVPLAPDFVIGFDKETKIQKTQVLDNIQKRTIF